MGISIQTPAGSGGGSFSNVWIEDNLIEGGNTQAIRMEAIHGFSVLGNTILTCPGYEAIIPAINISVGCSQGQIDRNIWAGVAGKQAVGLAAAAITLGRNLMVQAASPAAANYVGKVLANLARITRADFIAVAGGQGAGLGIH